MSEDQPQVDELQDVKAITPDVATMREHYVLHLGAPFDVARLEGNPDPASPMQELEIACFAPGGFEAPVLFATCGVSQAKTKAGERIEGLFLVRPAPRDAKALDAIHKVLGAFALYPFENDVSLAPGDVIQCADELKAISDMDALLFLPPVQFVESFQKAPRWDGEQVSLLWILPVFEAEAEYALEHGADALLMLFAAQGLDLTNLRRDEANTVLAPEDAADLAKKREAERAAAPAKRRIGVHGPGAPKRRFVRQTDSFETSEEGGELVITRRSKKKKVEEAPEPTPQAPVGAEGSKAKVPPGRSGPGAKGPVRFNVPKKDAPKRPLGAKPKPKAPERSPHEEKLERIEKLKSDARARAQRAKNTKPWRSGSGGNKDSDES